MKDLASRVPEWVHLTTDGWLTYPEAVRRAFGHKVHYAQLIKNYGGDPDLSETERRYSPTVCVSAMKARVIGNPDMGTVSTSIVERANLEIRTNVRRFMRLTNGYSKKAENHAYAFSLFAMIYNFCRLHGPLSEERGINTTPAMAAGLEERPWRILEVVERMDGERQVFAVWGRYLHANLSRGFGVTYVAENTQAEECDYLEGIERVHRKLGRHRRHRANHWGCDLGGGG
ncbi:MAG: hypothetical protein OYK82_04720 [Gammaproteobacteria bacterium]|nr:hypothetical protein [Gammaproteobacteria bacterium]